jgi:predicted nucleic acid-binding protein
MKRVFVDTNVIMDFLGKREPHYANAMKLFDFAFSKKIKIAISSLSVLNAHYLLGKCAKEDEIRILLHGLCSFCELVKIDRDTIENALRLNFSDMEDGVQYLCAQEAKASVIVTRNEKDFKNSQIPVVNTEEFIAGFKAQRV